MEKHDVFCLHQSHITYTSKSLVGKHDWTTSHRRVRSLLPQWFTKSIGRGPGYTYKSLYSQNFVVAGLQVPKTTPIIYALDKEKVVSRMVSDVKKALNGLFLC